jgi:membrane dipeptidase
MTDHIAAARRIHTDLPVVDGHNDLPWAIRSRADSDLERADPSGSLPDYHTDIPRLLQGGVGGQFWSVYVPADSEHPHRMTLEQTDLVKRMVAHDDRLELASTAADVRRIRAEGRIASLMGAEGGHSIENSLDKLRALHDAGVRYMTLTHLDTTDWADSGTDAPRHGGLNDFCRDVVREMNRLGMLVDVSHVSVDTMRDALDTSRAPIIASHSNADALAPHPRNVPDDVLAAIGASGGVVMVAFFSAFVVAETAAILGELYPKWREIRRRYAGDEERIRQEIERTEAGVEWDLGTVSDVVDHIEHVAAVAGVDAVGLGSDFDGCSMIPAGLEDVSRYPAITVELLRRGWTESDIRGVLGNNILRVLEAAEQLAG